MNASRNMLMLRDFISRPFGRHDDGHELTNLSQSLLDLHFLHHDATNSLSASHGHTVAGLGDEIIPA